MQKMSNKFAFVSAMAKLMGRAVVMQENGCRQIVIIEQ
jgi:hypothetical protein